MTDTIACPHCGGEIRADAHYCRHCGSSDSDGWRDEFESDSDDFDYDEFVADNFSPSSFQTSIPRLWRIVAIVLLLLFLLGFLML